MTKAYSYLLVLAVCCLTFGSCRNATTDAYYERPEWLEQPIYQILESRGNFTNYLKCVDKTAYASVLKAAGLYTVFAPTDEAFNAWLTEKHYNSVDDIPLQDVKDLVSYSIVYSKWTTDKLAYRFVKKAYEVGAFKRKSTCYAMPHRDSEYDNAWVVDETVRGGLSYSQSDYVLNLTKQNYKYLPVFTDEFLKSSSPVLTNVDYNTFFPTSTYTGLNVQAGTISESNILAENGLIHVVTSVNEPLDNIETILQNPQYKSYYNLLTAKEEGKYLFRTYQDVTELNANLLETYQTMMPDSFSQLYVKEYSSDLGFSPIMETILSEENSDDSEKSGNTVFVPNNDSLEKYIDTKLCKYYKREDLPSTVLQTLINTHMVKGMVWPTLYQETQNVSGEYINGLGRQGKTFDDAGILSKTMASNGLVYQTANVIKSRYFETVFSDIYLNPNDYLLNLAYDDLVADLRDKLLRCSLNGYISERWTIMNLKDSLLYADGFGYDDINAEFTHTEATADTRMQRLINLHIFPGIENGVVNSTVTNFTEPAYTGKYNGYGFIVTNSGDMIRYKDNKLQAAGNIEDKTFCTVTPVKDEFNNGYVYNVDGMMQYSPVKTNETYKYSDIPLWDYLDRTRKENTNVSLFVDYVEACLMNADGGLDGIKTDQYYTVLMPNNNIMKSAVKANVIPQLDSLTTEGDNKLTYVAQATKFVNAHFLVGQVIADDGRDYIYPVNELSPNEVVLPTLLKITEEKYDYTNKVTQVRIYKESGQLRFEPLDSYYGNTLAIDGVVGTGKSGAFIKSVNQGTLKNLDDNFRSNRIAGKAVLHEITNYIHFDVK